jgi:hypothetical protein
VIRINPLELELTDELADDWEEGAVLDRELVPA